MSCSVTSWLKTNVIGTRRNQPRSAARTIRSTHLNLELLEDRLTPSFSLGTSALVEGPAAGVATVIVAGPGSWSASANATWLHTTSSGTGNGLAAFTFDANAGATRSGTLS